MKRFYLFLIFSIVSAAFLGFVRNESAAAASMCGVLAAAKQDTGNNHDCLTYGQNYTALTSLSESESSSELQIDFINKMNNFLTNGQHLQKIGARYITCEITGQGQNYKDGCSGWETRVQGLRLKVTNYNPNTGTGGFHTCKNTAYDPDADEVVGDSPDCGTYNTLEFFDVNNKLVYAIKTDCGNPLGDLDGDKGWTLTGKSATNGNASTSDNITDITLTAPGKMSGGKLVSSAASTKGIFAHDVNNNGAEAATYSWSVQGCRNDNDDCSNINNFTGSHDGGNALGGSLPSSNGNVSGAKDTDHPDWGSDKQSGGAKYAYEFPADVQSGTRYCQVIYYTDANGNNTASDHSVRTCVTLNVTPPPGGASCTISPSSATTNQGFSYTVKITYGSKPAANITIAITGDFTVSGKTSGTASDSLSSTSAGLSAGTKTANFKVSTSPALTGSCTMTVGGGGPSGNCPGDPGFNSSARTTLTTPFNHPNSTAGAPSGSTSAYGAVYNQDINISNDTFAAHDTSGFGSGGDAPPTISGYNADKTTVTINPNPIVAGYPYDSSSADVTYTTHYTVQKWTATKFDHYQCDGGKGSDGASNNSSCGTYTTQVQDGVSCRRVRNGVCEQWNNCPNQGTAPNCYHNQKNNYPGPTSYYTYQKAGTSSGQTNNHSSGYNVNECYDRAFTVNSVSVTTNIQPSSEDPQTGNSQASTSVSFSYNGPTPTAGLRHPFQVSGLSYSSSGCSGGASGTVSVSDGYAPSSGNTAALAGGGCSATAPPLQAGDTVCATYNVNPTGTSVNQFGTITSSNGQTVSGSDCSAPISDKPYSHFFGADISAGGAFASGQDQCVNEPGAQGNGGKIDGNVNTAGAQTKGTGSQFGAFSNGGGGHINGFNSAILRNNSGTLPTPNIGFLFANRGFPANAATTTGASLGVPHCVIDYYNSRSGPKIVAGNGNFSISDTMNGSYQAGGSPSSQVGLAGGQLNPGPNSPVGNGQNIVIYVNGNLDITGNVVFNTAGWAVDTLHSNIPSLYVIVKGNIYIEPGVTQLDGVYIAEGDGITGGVLNTCATNFNSIPASNLYNSCKSQLTVNGAFIANNVHLYRTFASLRNGVPGEFATSGVPNCFAGDLGNPKRSLASTNYDCASEIFEFGPEVYLGVPGIPASNGPNSGKFDYITSLSPVF